MQKDQLNVRLKSDIMEALNAAADSTGKTKTAIVSDALASYLNVERKQVSIEALAERVEALEAKYKRLAQSKGNQRSQNVKDKPKKPAIDAEDVGELITMEQAAQLTGYAEGTLRSNFSRKDIHAQKRIDGNRGGLYSKKEIIEKIGYK